MATYVFLYLNETSTKNIYKIDLISMTGAKFKLQYVTYVYNFDLTDQNNAYARYFNKIYTDLSEIIQHHDIVVYDLSHVLILNQLIMNCHEQTFTNTVYNLSELTAIFLPQYDDSDLFKIAQSLNIVNDTSKIVSNAYLCAKIFKKIMAKIEQLPEKTISHIRKLESSFRLQRSPWLYDRPNKKSEPDHTYLTAYGLMFKKTSHELTNDPILTKSYGELLDEIYEENPDEYFEKRYGQREMSELIFDAFRLNKHALLEAETGVGKTMAYLIPALFEALTQEEQLIISTYTNQLQTQVIEEMTKLRSFFPFPINTAILKGKRHYLSLKRLAENLTANKQMTTDTFILLAKLLVWITETTTGDLAELHVHDQEKQLVNELTVEAEQSTHTPIIQTQWCYYDHALKNTEQAQIVITNHALLCSDIAKDYRILPSYQKVIIDEAHHLEEVARKQFALIFNYRQFHVLLNQLGSMQKHRFIYKLFKKHGQTDDIMAATWDISWHAALNEGNQLYSKLTAYVIQAEHHYPKDGNKTKIYFEQLMKNRLWQELIDIAERIIFYMNDLSEQLKQIKGIVNHQAFADIELISNHIRELEHINFVLEQLFINDSSGSIKWVETDSNSHLFVYCLQTNNANDLQQQFFSQKKSVILTSATLTVKKSFSYICKQLGLQTEEVIIDQFASPFNYEQQALLMIPKDFPDIKELDTYISTTAETIIQITKLKSKKILILFTSFAMMSKVYDLLNGRLPKQFTLIAQNISGMSRQQLKHVFQSAERAILLGTKSFWEGINLPGQALSCLIIVRLPFQSPNDPIYDKKASELRKQGKNPFIELALPEAVLTFKQGIGRLIRSQIDYGIVFVFDSRLYTAHYRQFFLESIPEIPLSYNSTHSLLQTAKSWLREKSLN